MTKFNRQKAASGRGFTLLEVLVALAVLAISAVAVIGQTGQSLVQLQQLQQKTLALVVADNRLQLLAVSGHWPNTGVQSQTLSAFDQQWQVTTEVSGTSEPWLRKVEVTVSVDSYGEPQKLASLTGYRGRY